MHKSFFFVSFSTFADHHQAHLRLCIAQRAPQSELSEVESLVIVIAAKKLAEKVNKAQPFRQIIIEK